MNLHVLLQYIFQKEPHLKKKNKTKEAKNEIQYQKTLSTYELSFKIRDHKCIDNKKDLIVKEQETLPDCLLNVKLQSNLAYV